MRIRVTEIATIIIVILLFFGGFFLGRQTIRKPQYVIYAIDEEGSCKQVNKVVIVPSGSITEPNDIKKQWPRYVYVEK
ncbi:MAG TPA: hypothetical protein HPP87_04595 [Planctomycetes bacterium]|nr:hypothetical protein [Planctomycetota bacterium]HIJ70626.1 hypothetical protein [Planctomycetota bacterium]